MNRSLLREKHLSQYLLISAAFFFLLYTLHFNVDLSDEGFYLYNYELGSESITFNFYHYWIHPIGEIFKHHLIFYRYLSVFLVLSVSIWLGHVLNSSFFISACLGLLYFNGLSTFSYNTTVLVGGVLTLISIYSIKNSTRKYLWDITLALSAFCVFSARLSSGVCFLLLGLLGFCLQLESAKDMRKHCFYSIVVFISLLLLALILWSDSLLASLDVLKILSQSSHRNLLGKYVINTHDFLLKAVLPPFLIIWLSKRYLKKYVLVVSVIFFTWIFFRNIFFYYHYPTLGFYSCGFLTALAIVRLIDLWGNIDELKKWIVFTLIPISVCFVGSLGTNINLYKISSFLIVILFPSVDYLLLRKMANRKIFLLVNVLLYSFTVYSLTRSQLLYPYFSRPRNEVNFVVSKLSVLEGIKIEDNKEFLLSSVEQFLSQNSYNLVSDRMFVYADAPGVVSILKARSFGSPWNISFYKNSEEANCAHLKLGKVPEGGRIFVIEFEPIPLKLQMCLQSRADKAPLVFYRSNFKKN